MRRHFFKLAPGAVLLAASAGLIAQSTFEQDQARQSQHVYEENVRAQQRQSQQQSDPAWQPPQRSMRWVSSHGAIAVHMDAANFWVATGARSFDTAITAARDACNRAMQGGCIVILDGRNGQFVVGMTGEGTIAAGFAGTKSEAKGWLRKTCDEMKRECRELAVVRITPWQEPASWGPQEIRIADQTAPRLRVGGPARIQRRSHVMLALPKNYSARETDHIWIGAGPSWDGLRGHLLSACRADNGVECEIAMSASGAGVIVEYRSASGENFIRTAVSAKSASDMVSRQCKKLKQRCTITAVHTTAQLQLRRLPPVQ